ncbi:group III truncated hemoglobin [Mucilaginibacter ginsenosidivorans]|uniref:Group III truncated hemoglobin n=1 Tax=Mucilaginibacter ginsenosidivorans TaxID=398053 RepID=A0A5B8V2L3_9SPHI|nr:group III truncated hemoglobin [Mucilaginibacter ginsenosidivorans]QEC64921.1 group III truncated hemoglobin [Mucilaginibacter ginsenosidivorans]
MSIIHARKDIENREDIRLLVENFYRKVTGDEMIGEIFRDVLVFRWDTHIPVMIDFWESVLLGGTSYRGNAMRVHIDLDKKHRLSPVHFERWKKLFFETIDEHFAGEKGDEAKKKTELMETLMLTKIDKSRGLNFIQ